MNAEDITIIIHSGGVSILKQNENKAGTTKTETILSHCCFNVVTLLLPCCRTIIETVTILSQCCPKATTVMTDGPSGWCRLGPMLK